MRAGWWRSPRDRASAESSPPPERAARPGGRRTSNAHRRSLTARSRFRGIVAAARPSCAPKIGRDGGHRPSELRAHVRAGWWHSPRDRASADRRRSPSKLRAHVGVGWWRSPPITHRATRFRGSAESSPQPERAARPCGRGMVLTARRASAESSPSPSKLRAHVGCDQAMLVRKERKVRSPSRNTEASSSGCESRPIRPARRVGSEPCDGHDGERAEAGRQRARRCVGTQTSELCDVSLETGDISSVQGIPCPEDHDIDLTRWHRRSMYSTGSRYTARSKKTTQ